MAEHPTDSPDSPPPHNRLRASDADRDTVLRVLGEAHAAGRLDADELAERQDRALASRYLDELPPLLADLPEGSTALTELSPQSAPGFREPTLPATPGAGRADVDVAIMSGSDTTVAAGTPELTVIGFMGGNTYRLDSVLGPGVELTVNAYSLMSGHHIFVPPGVRIIDRTVNIMAGNRIHRGAEGDGSGGTLILTGLSLMSGHDIKPL